jgi:hypothetical protein
MPILKFMLVLLVADGHIVAMLVLVRVSSIILVEVVGVLVVMVHKFGFSDALC